MGESNTITQNIYTSDPFIIYLNVTKLGNKYYCSYYDEDMKNYSVKGMETMEKTNSLDSGLEGGMLKCSSTHLTIFSASENPYVEIKGVLEDSNYKDMANTKSLEDYDPVASTGREYIYIYI